MAPILLIVLALAIIGSDIDVAAESNLMGVYVDPSDVDPRVLDDFEKRFDFHGLKEKGQNARHLRGKLRNKHKHTKSNYGVPTSQYEPIKPYGPSKAHNKPKGKYPPKTQYSVGPVKAYVAPVYNSPTYIYSLPVYSSPAHKSPVSSLQYSSYSSPQALVAYRPSLPTTPRYKNSPSIRPKTSPPTRPKISPPTRPKTSPPTRPKTLTPTRTKISPPTQPKTSRPSSRRPTYHTTSPTTTTRPTPTTSSTTTASTSAYSSAVPVSTTISTTVTSSPLNTSTPYNSSKSSTSSPSDFSSLKPGSNQSKKKIVPPKKEIIPIKLKNEVPIKPVPYTPNSTPHKANSTTSISVVKEKVNEGFFSSPVDGFPNFFKQLLQG